MFGSLLKHVHGCVRDVWVNRGCSPEISLMLLTPIMRIAGVVHVGT